MSDGGLTVEEDEAIEEVDAPCAARGAGAGGRRPVAGRHTATRSHRIERRARTPRRAVRVEDRIHTRA